MKEGPSSFPLRLPRSTRQRAVELAHNEGLSLNQFIVLAVTEKIVRLELLNKAGDLQQTSANRQKEPSHTSAADTGSSGE